MKVKIFTGNNHREIEADVNQWLDNNSQASITDILQTESYIENGWSLTITIVYVASFERH